MRYVLRFRVESWFRVVQPLTTCVVVRTWETSVLCVEVQLPLPQQEVNHGAQAVHEVDVVTPAWHVLGEKGFVGGGGAGERRW